MSENASFQAIKEKNKMKIQLFLLCTLCIICSGIAGCCFSGKTVTVVDVNGMPVADCPVVAVENNIAWNNRAGLYRTDRHGSVNIPFHSLLYYFAGKEGYRISIKQSAEKDVRIVLYERNKILPMQRFATKTKFTDQITPAALEQLEKNPEFHNWLRYSRNTFSVMEE